MPDAIITSTASTFGTISGTFAADQSTITGTISGIVAGTLSGSVGVPGPAGPAGAGVPAGGTAGQYLQKIDGVDYNTDWVTLNLSAYAPLNSPAFTGNPTAPTAALGDNDTSLATTAFVQQELLSGTANAKNLEVYVRNQTGSTLAAGAIVYINGATGNRPTVTLAQANNDANSAQTMGFVKTDIANNGFGFVIVRGECEGLDTSAVAEGTQLYLSPTVAGAYTTTKPSAPQHLVYVGIVIRSHPTQGVILVAVQNGYELNELHDVSITSPTNGQVLKYNSTTGLWYNGTDSAGVAWGGITGTLSNQTDLQTALDGKYSTTNPAGYITSSALTGYATESFVTSQGYLVDAPSDGNQYARMNGAWDIVSAPPSYITSVSSPLSVSSGDLTIDLSLYATESWVTSGFYSSTNPSGYITSSALLPYAPLGGSTFTGKVNTAASTTTNAGLNLPHGTAPTSPVNGDIWTTTTSLQWRRNGTTATVANSSLANTFSAGQKQTVSHSATNAGFRVAPIAGDPSTLADGDVWHNLTTLKLRARVNSVSESIALESWVTAQNYITSAALSPYLLSSTAASTYQTIAGMSSYLTTSAAASTYYPLTGNPSGFITSSALTGYATESWVTSQGYLTSAPVTSVAGKTGAVTLVVGDVSGAAPLASPTFTGTPSLPTGTIAVTQSPGDNTTAVATTAFVTAAVPAYATSAQGRSATSTTTAMNPSVTAWQRMFPGTVDIVRSSLTYAATGTMGTTGTGFLLSRMTLGTAGACSANFRTFGASQIDQGYGLWSQTYRSYVNFSKLIWCSGRFYTEDNISDPNVTVAFYCGKAQNSANGDLARAGFGWKFSGNATAGNRKFVVCAHNGTTLTTVTSSFAIVAQQYVDWDVVSNGSGTVTLYINGNQVATTTGGPTADTTYSGTAPVIWNEEMLTTGVSAGFNATFGRGRIYMAP